MYEPPWIFLSLLLLRVDNFRNFTINYVFTFLLLKVLKVQCALDENGKIITGLGYRAALSLKCTVRRGKGWNSV